MKLDDVSYNKTTFSLCGACLTPMHSLKSHYLSPCRSAKHLTFAVMLLFVIRRSSYEARSIGCSSRQRLLWYHRLNLQSYSTNTIGSSDSSSRSSFDCGSLVSQQQ
jgi:hypothetical protein